uniref:ACB domain-containing protein n=2 Tax=Terrapene triunguis TaxID=2587831 RepID=A0A674J9U2_9SAUR
MLHWLLLEAGYRSGWAFNLFCSGSSYGPDLQRCRALALPIDFSKELHVLRSYRPPYEVMLRFYSYYKQATVGSCEIPRPGFWDPIGRYKWDAWNRLGKMSREEAMAAYISEMKKIAQKVQTWGIGRVAGLG